jgi:ribosome-associated protein
VDVVVHLFDAERRRYYDLELLWGDAPRIEWEQQATA